MPLDIVIRNGRILDGSGSKEFVADIGIANGIIVEIGAVAEAGNREIDATGLLVTPGFVDIHTHYDAQITWENRLSPSSDHGVTTVVMGNCAIGLAPCRPADHETLIRVVAGVEDIPEAIMAEGLAWNWETYPEYLDVLAKQESDVDFASQLAHSPMRVYVMGERGSRREPASAVDLARMTEIVREALKAGAIGVSTSRSAFHRTSDGHLAPSETANIEELTAIARGVREAGTGVIETMSEFNDLSFGLSTEFDAMRHIAQVSGRPVSFTLVQTPQSPDTWPILLDLIDRANRDGLTIRGQVAPRAVGMSWGLDLSFNTFSFRKSYEEIAHLPLPERVAQMRRPEVKARILSEAPNGTNASLLWFISMCGDLYVLSDPPNYEPPADQKISALAAAKGVTAEEYVYDQLLENEGHTILYFPIANYGYGNLEPSLTMMRNENTLIGLGDGGAHYGLICDASYPTFALTHWCRDRQNGDRLELPWMVNALSRRNALAVGLGDRGLIARGYKADINVIDFEKLSLEYPEVVYNLPGGGRRMIQRAKGYVATIVSGHITYENGVATGTLPGRLVRFAREAPELLMAAE